MKNGYLETIQNGISGVRSFSSGTVSDTGSIEENLERLKHEIENSDAIVIGAGAGLSTAAGLTYSGSRFKKFFFDFAEKFGITDIYSGGFYAFPDAETTWAWWARHLYFNRYIDPPKPVYKSLLSLVKGRDYFVITTNVDHQFQRAGFDKNRLFYTQGDYGLFQSADGKVRKTFDNEDWVLCAKKAQGFVQSSDGVFDVPENGLLSMRIPPELIPKCPDESDVAMNLRSDDTFVEDEGWHKASAAYADFLDNHDGQHVLYLELGVGANTPVIIKYPFWQMAASNSKAVYACVNFGEAFCPKQIERQSICINEDISDVLEGLI